jgi:subtilisin-like proprotein convertase family protein
VPVLLTPAEGAVDQPLTPTFTWSAAAQAASYEVEIATDAAFSNIVDTVAGLTTTSYTPGTPLGTETVYHWRVRAANPCGSMVSDPGSFQTLAVVCQIYTSSDVPKAIPDNNPLGVTSTLDVPASGAILDVNVLGLTGLHTWISDLTFDLISPANTTVRILDGPCSYQDNFDLSLDDEAAGPYPCPPTGGGTYLPDNPLSAFDGQGSPGTWRLNITDHYSSDLGQLQAWGLEICTRSFTPRERVYLPLVISKP